MDKTQKYWVVVASKDHVMRGVAGGFMQANHGKQAPLKRMKPSDWVLFYSPKQFLESDTRCQAFTAIGQVGDDTVYQVTVTEDFVPFRRNVTFHPAAEVSILPLIDDLDFIPNKKSWGYPFRFGFFEINQADFNLIRERMIG
jgi:hypothetical protein